MYIGINGVNIDLKELVSESMEHMLAKIPALQTKVSAVYQSCIFLPQIYMSYQSYLLGGRQCTDVEGISISNDHFRNFLNECATFNYYVDVINQKVRNGGFVLSEAL